MSSIQELREKRTAKAREYRNLLDSHTGAIGSTIPESTPPKNAFGFPVPSARSGMEIIAPSGKFWIAIPSDSASAPINVICTFPVR